MLEIVTSRLIIGADFLLQMAATGFLLAIEIEKPWLTFHILFTLATSAFYLAIHFKDVDFLLN